jgi:hypothetical protein
VVVGCTVEFVVGGGELESFVSTIASAAPARRSAPTMISAIATGEMPRLGAGGST